MNLHEFDKTFYNNQIKTIAGMDEAGRGPLAGPVVAAIVVLPDDFYMDTIKDSKKISEKKRLILFDQIKKNAIDYGIGVCHENEIDQINILQSTYKAMKKALGDLQNKPDLTLIDGLKGEISFYNCKYIVKGDAKSQSIAAASILAKVYRDKMMLEYDKIYPEYGFAKHKGYGTKFHIDAIKEFKSCPIHRRSFKPIEKYIPTFAFFNSNFKLNQLSIKIVASSFVKNNYKILKIYKNDVFDILHAEKNRIVLSKINIIINQENIVEQFSLNDENYINEIKFLEKELKEHIEFDVILVQLSKLKPKISIKKNVYK